MKKVRDLQLFSLQIRRRLKDVELSTPISISVTPQNLMRPYRRRRRMCKKYAFQFFSLSKPFIDCNVTLRCAKISLYQNLLCRCIVFVLARFLFDIYIYQSHHTSSIRHKVNFKKCLRRLNSEISCHTNIK